MVHATTHDDGTVTTEVVAPAARSKPAPLPSPELRLSRENEAKWRSRWELERKARVAWEHHFKTKSLRTLDEARAASAAAEEATRG